MKTEEKLKKVEELLSEIGIVKTKFIKEVDSYSAMNLKRIYHTYKFTVIFEE